MLAHERQKRIMNARDASQIDDIIADDKLDKVDSMTAHSGGARPPPPPPRGKSKGRSRAQRSGSNRFKAEDPSIDEREARLSAKFASWAKEPTREEEEVVEEKPAGAFGGWKRMRRWSRSMAICCGGRRLPRRRQCRHRARARNAARRSRHPRLLL